MNFVYIVIAVFFLIFVISYIIFRKTKKKEEVIELTDEFKEILDILNNTNQSIFISGEAGTGKSTLLNHFTKNTNKKNVVVAPTGAAALNVKGQTIYSFFQFPPKLLEESDVKIIFSKNGLFAHGQTYVALSRCKTLDGIILNKEIRPEHIIVDNRIIEFYSILNCQKELV